MKFKVVLKNIYKELEFVFGSFEEASIFIETAITNGVKGTVADIEVVKEE